VEPIFVEGVGGIPIATWELATTRPDQPTLVVAHATGFHSRCYRAMAVALKDRFGVVGFDLRGHGHSGTPPLSCDDDGLVAAMDWKCLADDALAVIDGLGLARPVAFGHSCGGAVVLHAEARRPGTFTAIYAYEPVVGPPEVWAAMNAADANPSEAARRRRRDFVSRAAALEHFSSKPPLSSMRSDVMVDYVDGGFADSPDGSITLRCSPEAEAATFSMAPHSAAWDGLAGIACPVVVGCGGDSGPFGVTMAVAVADRVDDGRVDAHRDLGHLGPFQRPDALAGAVLDSVGD